MLTLPIRFSQLDLRWSGLLLGNNTDPRYNIYNYGCLLCCMAMILKYYGIDIDPARLNQILIDNKAFEPGSGIYDWGALNRIYLGISDTVIKTPGKLSDDQMAAIKSSIDSGVPVILQIDYNPKIVTPTMHFVVAVAYNPNDENDFTIADPLGGKLHSLKDYLGWYHPSSRDTIEAFAPIIGPVPKANDGTSSIINAELFDNLVHGSTQWDKTLDKYMNGADPKLTQFEDFDKVIGGIKSRATDFQKQLTNQLGDLAAAEQSVINLKEQLANEEKQRQDDQNMYLAQLGALKTSGSNLEKISQTYEGRIQALQGQVKVLLQDKHDLATNNARLSSQAQVISITKKYFPTFIAWFKKLNSPRK